SLKGPRLFLQPFVNVDEQLSACGRYPEALHGTAARTLQVPRFAQVAHRIRSPTLARRNPKRSKNDPVHISDSADAPGDISIAWQFVRRSEEHTSELQSLTNLV